MSCKLTDHHHPLSLIMPPVDQVTRFFVCFLKVEASQLSKTSIAHRLKQLAYELKLNKALRLLQDALFIAWCLNPNGWCIHLECSNERTVACSVSYQCQVLISLQLLEEKKAANIYIKKKEKEKKRWCFLSATHFGGWYVSDCVVFCQVCSLW